MVTAEMVLDVICVHSYIGYARFARAAERLRAQGVEVEAVFRPFELAPGAPADPQHPQPLLTVLEQVFGPSAVAQTEQTTRRAAQEGLELHYERAIASGTFEAHRLIARAAAQGKAEAMVERLFRAHFTDGLHIGDPAVFRRLAQEAGVALPDGYGPGSDAAEAAELRAELDRVRGLGVTGVPVFLIGEQRARTGAQSEEALYQALERAAGAA